MCAMPRATWCASTCAGETSARNLAWRETSHHPGNDRERSSALKRQQLWRQQLWRQQLWRQQLWRRQIDITVGAITCSDQTLCGSNPREFAVGSTADPTIAVAPAATTVALVPMRNFPRLCTLLAFIAIHAATPAADVDFASPHAAYLTGSGPRTVAIGKLDNNSSNDVVVGNGYQCHHQRAAQSGRRHLRGENRFRRPR